MLLLKVGLNLPPPGRPYSYLLTFNPHKQNFNMGRKAKNKQAPPTPLPGSTGERKQKPANKKRAKSSAAGAEIKGIKSRGPAAKSIKERQRRVKAVDRVDDDSDLDEALRPGWVLPKRH